MIDPESIDDPELRNEQEYLNMAHESLSAMRARAETLVRDVRSAGQPDLDYLAALTHRVAVLGVSSRPLLFGRIDEETGPTWHIGRRHVEDVLGDHVVVDWRAPVSMPFYRARVEDTLGLKLRRQVMVDRRQVIAVADDLFGDVQGEMSGTRLRGGDALLAELERARTGEMLDIVATIQAEQDEIIRAPLDRLLSVQGGPGTGKTAVGLHRAAFLLYNHPTLTQDGVLVLGPSRAFLRYISAVLPSLGEEAVVQSTVADLAPRLTLRSVDPPEVRRLKGDPRMSLLLTAALQVRRRTVEEDVTLRARFDRELPASEEFHTLLDHVWPSVSPTALVSEVLTSADRLAVAAEGIFTEPEWRSLLRTKGKRVGTQAWTVDDLPLLDEAEYLINGRTRTYGHVVVDEAQDLSPMQFRMVARRSPSGSLTILGDLAQATGPWNYATWDEILRHLPDTSVSRHDELTLGYRAPGQILDLASKLLPEAAPRVQPTRSIRQGRQEPRITQVDRDDLFAHSVREATTLADEGLLVGVVVSAGDLAGMTAFVGERGDIGLLDRDGMHRRVTVVEATAAKGLEFDAVVVVEPAAMAGGDARGLRLLYVAMTRPIQHLSMVHAEPLPPLLLT